MSPKIGRCMARAETVGPVHALPVCDRLRRLPPQVADGRRGERDAPEGANPALLHHPFNDPVDCLDSLRTPGACRQGRGEQDGHGPDRMLSHCCRLPAATSRDVPNPGDEPRQGDSGAAHRMVDASSNRRNGCASPGGSGAQSRDRKVGTTSSTFQLRSGRSPYQSRVGSIFSLLFRKSQSTIRRSFDLVLAGWLSRSPDVFARFGVIERSNLGLSELAWADVR